jgi:cytochrome c-type biogenesis protein CcmF
VIELIGNSSLCGAVLAAAAAVLAAVAAARSRSIRALALSRWLIVTLAALVSIAAGTLIVALQTSDFRFQYVADYTERALPSGYKFAAFWAGQAGSLLLWTWLLAMLCVLACAGWRRSIAPGATETAGAAPAAVPLSSRIVMFAGAQATLALVCGFFAVLLLFTANPFQLVEGQVPPDGRGLNPQLQDLAMIIHPPLLFVGYAAYTIPFALLIGVLAAGVRDNRWLSLVRRWSLLAWMFLGAGILMGAWWAYIELGWGGYWAWDPVENASLLPWLTGTALIHSIIIQQHRGMFRTWNAALIAGTFILCIFGTYLTRSGVIDSVHAFAESLIGTFFLAFLIVCSVASIALMLWRRRTLKSDRPLEGVVSREGAFLAGNCLLVIMMLTTLVGTIFPILGGVFGVAGVTVKPEFYNRVVGPMGILLVGLMALGPVLAFGVQASRKIALSLRMPLLCVVAVTLPVMILVTRNPWALTCLAIVTLGTATVIVDFARSLSARRRSTGEGPIASTLRLIDRDHRRYGGQLAHLGVMMIVVGVAGSSLFTRDLTQRVQVGEMFAAEGYAMRLAALSDLRGPNFSAVQATLEMTDAAGRTHTLTPQVRFYDMWAEQPNAEVAVRSNWRQDLYVSLAGWEDGGRLVALQVRINPLVLWIWVGGMVMVAGTLLCMLPRMLPSARTAPEPQRVSDEETLGVVELAPASMRSAAIEPARAPVALAPEALT